MGLYYKADVTCKSLKIGDIVRITKSTKTTMKYKKLEWEVTAVLAYQVKLKVINYPYKSLPDGQPADKEQYWDNDRVTWVKTPKIEVKAEEPKTKLKNGFFPGDKIVINETIKKSSIPDYFGVTGVVLGEVHHTYDNYVRVKPDAPLPLGFSKGSTEPFWLEAKYLSVTTTPASVEFKIGDLVEITGSKDSDVTKLWKGWKGEVLELNPGSWGKDYLRLKPTVMDRPDSMGKNPFVWQKEHVKLVALAGTTSPDHVVGDVVKINTPGSTYHDLPGRVIELGKDTGLFSGLVQIVPLRDRPESSKKTKREPFWWKSNQLVKFTETDFKVGDRVKILGAESGHHPNGSVGTITNLNSLTGWAPIKVEFKNSDSSHHHLASQLELTDAPFTAAYGLNPILEETEPAKPELKWEVGAHVKLISNTSGEHPKGTIGYLAEKLTGGYSEWVVKFEDDYPLIDHWHAQSELELTTEPMTQPKKTGSTSETVKLAMMSSDTHTHAAVVTMSPADQKKLAALNEISVIMNNKSISTVTRFETIAEVLGKVGMFK